MRFTKMHGLGNDYVYIDGSHDPSLDYARAARLVSDRHFAVGSDGLIAVCAPSSRDADIRMRMFNADGSEGEMCGNGIRCVAKFAVDRGMANANPLRVETGRGVLEVWWERGADGRVGRASVLMGAPILEHARIPARIEGVAPDARVAGRAVDLARWGEGWWQAAGVEPHITLVSMGNPHVVFACEDPWKVPLELVGPRIERDAWFPARINAHFVRFGPPTGEAGKARGEAGKARGEAGIAIAEALMRTWERGSGITLACGTGASAVCVAGVLLGKCGRTLEATLPGGALSLEWPGEGEQVHMTGPATEVYEGEVDLESLAASQSLAPSTAGAAHV